ncbi:MAG: bile acid:sodium symporter family protein, partial [Thermoanaerobaculia bacterium]
LLTVVTMPILTRVFELVLGRPFGFRVPVPALMGQLLLLLALPVGAGMFIRRHFPAFAARHGRGFRRLAFGSIALLIGFVVLSQWREFLRHLASMVVLAAAMVGASLLAGLLVGTVIGSDRRDRFTLAVEFATRNVAIASVISITLLGQVQFAVFAATYFVTEAPIVLAAVQAFRRGSRFEPERLAPA